MKMLMILFIIIMTTYCANLNGNEIAVEITKDKLLYLNNYLNEKVNDSTGEISSIIWFFELLTGIESESDANFAGKLWPTMNDYYRWKEWLDKNKENLSLDSNNQVIYIKEGKKE